MLLSLYLFPNLFITLNRISVIISSNSSSHSTPSPGSFWSTFCLYEFAYSRFFCICGAIQYLSFCVGFISLRIMFSRFIHVSRWINNIYTALLYPFIYRWTFVLFLSFCYCEWYYNKHWCTNICSSPCSQFFLSGIFMYPILILLSSLWLLPQAGKDSLFLTPHFI